MLYVEVLRVSREDGRPIPIVKEARDVIGGEPF